MKNTTLIFILAIFASLVFSQNKTLTANDNKGTIKFHVIEAFENDEDITENALYEMQYLQLKPVLEPKMGNIFSNVWAKSNSSSYGWISDFTHTSLKIDDEKDVEKLEFTWSYQNTCNDEKGTANVIIHIGNSHDYSGIFSMQISTDKGNVLIYYGEVEGF
jgi:hypothetical protein